MNHKEPHTLDVVCIYCVRDKCIKLEKLLKFVKDIKNYTFDDGMELPAKEYKGENIYDAANKLLEEIGETK